MQGLDRISCALLRSANIDAMADEPGTPAPPPTVVVRPDPTALAAAAASWLAAALRTAIGRRGTATLAVSGGSTPGLLFAALALEDVAWASVHVLQVDERIAPDGDPDRNLTELQTTLLDRVPLPITNFHAMPVSGLLGGTPTSASTSTSTAPTAAAADYSAIIDRLCGGVIDIVHLGLGDDGHTASLVPGDPVLDATDRDVAVTGEYKGRRRMTLTYPVLDRAGAILWLVAGPSKASVVPRLVSHDAQIPAGRVRNENAIVFADAAAAAQLAD